ncbi:peptidoglycan/xylan/chitin deacetylase (PgdA/CDA1 family) [Kribbella orskensis]|uniref:Peptidoglycan/xylan/chitin deacetylase (PgdA/CDA1 family) n=1 Tax=Kribbella orskensis TaxID=2512216 RepID=A0ABY2BH87_9ACTN|nr:MULTISPECIES: polysaccharide deacetylase family protein [Kribbella]TCN38439.1 peptidoglycan/xylan/chitin deacetylase (PgdA/CDA1 family) [Kribbella sp. VKM Ac-2500]TCO20031.1 peptidoglycan/xylan/chitin deacetylase (PgdA/CDA1 family) [Kribbella orskensis]
MVRRSPARGRRSARPLTRPTVRPTVATTVLGLIALLGISASCTPQTTVSPAHAAPQAAPTKYVLLTFDDGPDAKYTPQILEILKSYDAKATFFEVGQNVVKHPDLTKQIHEQGHSVQNHTWSHADLRKLSSASLRNQVAKTDQAIRAQTGYTPRCLRPPYGGVNKVVTQRTDSLDKVIRLWTVDSHDWERPGTSVIVKRVLTGVKDGSIVLMHDGGGNRSQTVAALPSILKTLQAKGYGFAATWCR